MHAFTLSKDKLILPLHLRCLICPHKRNKTVSSLAIVYHLNPEWSCFSFWVDLEKLPYSNPQGRATSPEYGIDNLCVDLFERLKGMKLMGSVAGRINTS